MLKLVAMKAQTIKEVKKGLLKKNKAGKKAIDVSMDLGLIDKWKEFGRQICMVFQNLDPTKGVTFLEKFKEPRLGWNPLHRALVFYPDRIDLAEELSVFENLPCNEGFSPKQFECLISENIADKEKNLTLVAAYRTHYPVEFLQKYFYGYGEKQEQYDIGMKMFMSSLRTFISWRMGNKLSNRIVVKRSTIEKQKGLFAKSNIKKGEVVAVFDGKIVKTGCSEFIKYREYKVSMGEFDKIPWPDQMGKGGAFMANDGPPNCTIVRIGLSQVLIALRNIDADDEVFWNYACSSGSHGVKEQTKYCLTTQGKRDLFSSFASQRKVEDDISELNDTVTRLSRHEVVPIDKFLNYTKILADLQYLCKTPVALSFLKENNPRLSSYFEDLVQRARAIGLG